MATPAPASAPPRADVAAKIRSTLERHHRVIVRGPAGVGKSVLLDQLVSEWDGDVVLAAYPGRTGVAFATLAELFANIETGWLDALTPPRRAAVETLLRLREPPEGGMDLIGLRLALRELLRGVSASRRVWFVVDAAERCDEQSLDLLTGLWRHLPAQRVGVLLSTRDAELSGRLAATGAREVIAPLWSSTEIRELLAPLELPHRRVSQVCRASGGLPGLATRIGEALAAAPDGTADHHAAILPLAEAVTGELLAELSPRARDTTLVAALATHVTERQLRQAGCESAHRDLAEAVRLGLVELTASGEVAFHAEAIRDVLVAKASQRTIRRIHRTLARVVTDPVASVRHRALAADRRQPELASELDRTVPVAQRTGEVALAAELALMAAELTPSDDTDALIRRWLNACQHAGSAGRVDWVERAAKAVCDLSQDPNDRLRARMAVIDAVGQDFGKVRQTFAAAESEARGDSRTDPGLHAELLTWMAWRTYVCDTNPSEVLSLSRRAADLAERGGNSLVHMQALTMVARMQRFLGLPGDETTLRRAVAVAPLPVRDVAGSASFLRARHALFDDRLDTAREQFTELLSLSERLGELKSLTEVLRSLAEVELRGGDCQAARTHIARAMDLLTGSDLSPSPVWYVAALVETHAGDRDRAMILARQGLASAREDNDVVFTARNEYVLGLLRLYRGHAEAAVRSLRETAALDDRCGVTDPSPLPFHGDLAEALIHIGQNEAALAVLTRARDTATRLGRHSVLPRLDLAESAHRIAVGDHQAAATLLKRALAQFTHYGLQLERGRTLLATASLERRRRKRARARELLTEAATLFAECHATPWRRQAETARAQLEHQRHAAHDDLAALTAGESRVVRLVAEGATNRQVASTLDVSVKTVEASLTRIYRKLGIQTRTQLAGYRRPDEPGT